ncbi:eCIS core domain-containing protein [Denitromonas iodatirespirans]|uniref:DUF4157 domain-containing protein n=1 Tax=Denitromonas iodatirespirans TaxID=2795389 RepID=A0A944D875_DENI1|nr:DUF4157 domain-containing protein [Denitromonas iodatirespirans]MBT0961754.1 DUF4157 domain-containing protein [Denitromonas iodatirespirans]
MARDSAPASRSAMTRPTAEGEGMRTTLGRPDTHRHPTGPNDTPARPYLPGAQSPHRAPIPPDGPIPATLRMTPPGDPLEAQADHVAAQVMRMALPPTFPPPPHGPSGPATVDRARTPPIATASAAGSLDVEPAASGVAEVVRAPGTPLDRRTRDWFEPRFGHDFGDVRIHADASAAASAQALDAHAYTTGRHVVLSRDAPSLDSASGKQLLAHELTHVVQQRSARQRTGRIVARQKKGQPKGDQVMSWSTPHADPPVIAQVFFATNSTALTDDDKQALQRVVDAINAHKGALLPAMKIEFEGYADPRSTSYKGGNGKLAYDRAESCEGYLRTHLSAKGRSNVILKSKSKGVDRALKQFPHRYQRMVLVYVDERIPPKKERRPAKSCKSAKQRCRNILSAHAKRFTQTEQRHLSHLLKDATTQDGFLNALDPELIKIAYGLLGEMTEKEAEAFVNRFKVCTDLKHHSFAGPDATDEDVIQALKGLHERIDGALDHLVQGSAKDTMGGGGNGRRVALNKYVAKARTVSNSIYFKW